VFYCGLLTVDCGLFKERADVGCSVGWRYLLYSSAVAIIEVGCKGFKLGVLMLDIPV